MEKDLGPVLTGIQGGGSRNDKCLLASMDKYKVAWHTLMAHIKAHSQMSETLKVSLVATMGEVLSDVEESLDYVN